MRSRGSCSVWSLAAFLALGMVSGCTRARNDAQVATDVQNRINGERSIPASRDIAVTSNNGIVTLTGNVGSENERQTAANDAAQVEGVKTVVNNLQVSTALAQATPESEAQPERQPRKPSSTQPRPAHAEHTARTTSKALRWQSAKQAKLSTPASNTVDITPSAPAPTAMAPAPPPPAPAPPSPPKPVTVPDGTVLQVRMIDSVDSASNQPGDRFRASLDTPITIDGKVVVPQGADVEGRVAELRGGGHFTGKPAIALELAAVSVNGQRYLLHTNQYSREGSARGKNTAEKVGGGAALGSIIGAIAGGGKGAALGGIIGAGAGGGVQAASKAPQIHVASESVVSFTLQNSVTVTPASSIQRGQSSRSAENNHDQSDSDQTQSQSDDPNGPVLKRR